MAFFCAKKLVPPVRVGLRLKQERECLKLSLSDITKLIRVPIKYLSAIEDGRFNDLPPIKTYRPLIYANMLKF